jgi:hypothetical protein
MPEFLLKVGLHFVLSFLFYHQVNCKQSAFVDIIGSLVNKLCGFWEIICITVGITFLCFFLVVYRLSNLELYVSFVQKLG